ncbi:MAG: hypothetical protein ACHQFW_11910 [Chitinophagales bacterium]
MKKLISLILLMSLVIVSCETQDATPFIDENAVFQSFSTNGQTILQTSINTNNKHVKIEVDHDVDVTSLIPEFDIPEGYTVYANGVEQVSGVTKVDFSQPVTYELKNKNNQSTSWEVSAAALGCKILIDASHDGGVWWFPQWEGTGFNPNAYHQGQDFANILRAKGFEVTELGRGVDLAEEMFFGYYIVIRASGFQPYKTKELEVYSKLIERGMNLVFLTDHKKNDPVDELGDHLGIQFKGVAFGKIQKFTPHVITNNITSIDYIAGSVITNTNPNMEILGWLGENNYADLNMNEVRDVNEPLAPPVMGILKYPNSRIFFIGDMNGIEVRPQPFIDNLIHWMGDCSQW